MSYSWKELYKHYHGLLMGRSYAKHVTSYSWEGNYVLLDPLRLRRASAQRADRGEGRCTLDWLWYPW